MELREIGTIVRLQVQRASLKAGEKPLRTYDPSPLLPVERVRVSPAGVVALLPDRATVIDVHHRDHPHSKYADRNAVSIGFTANYARMRERFGDRVWNGCAGENILIESAAAPGLADLERGVIIRCRESGVDLWLKDAMIDRPCVEFSRYSLQMPGADRSSAAIKETLQFLDGGVRGYYLTPANEDGALVVAVGDRVYVPVTAH
jgi:hypothetical protein